MKELAPMNDTTNFNERIDATKSRLLDLVNFQIEQMAQRTIASPAPRFRQYGEALDVLRPKPLPPLEMLPRRAAPLSAHRLHAAAAGSFRSSVGAQQRPRRARAQKRRARGA
jgi:hypothetical protein